MFFETIKSNGLAHLSYMLGHDGTCVVIDPRRDVDVYLERAKENELEITHILETHIHADFVSGSRELADRTGATIYGGAIRNEDQGSYGFQIETLDDGDEVEVGGLKFRAIHTPGHSSEHLCYVVCGGGDGAQKEWGVFTGDVLFAGEVGRPDLEPGADHQELAEQLHDSLRKLTELDGGCVVYPCHGEGSPCGSSIGARDSTTIGYERRFNERLNIQDKDEFVEELMKDLENSPAPAYYKRMKRLNLEGASIYGAAPMIRPVSADRLDEVRGQSDVVIVDTREIEAFASAHIAGSLNIAWRGSFPVWAGRMLDPSQEIYVVANPELDIEAVRTHFMRLNLNLCGFLRGGFSSWFEAGKEFGRLNQLSVGELHARLNDNELQLVDVRDAAEFSAGHIAGAKNIFVPAIRDSVDELDRERPIATYCGSGYRASIAASVLAANGFQEVYNVPGSVKAWLAAGYELEA